MCEMVPISNPDQDHQDPPGPPKPNSTYEPAFFFHLQENSERSESFGELQKVLESQEGKERREGGDYRGG